jgi:hypothetical protein
MKGLLVQIVQAEISADIVTHTGTLEEFDGWC